MSRTAYNEVIKRWAGREWALRQNRAAASAGIVAARRDGNLQEATLSYGQDAGLIHSILPVREIVDTIVRDAESIVSRRLPGLVRNV
jgi:hypothetical protein